MMLKRMLCLLLAAFLLTALSACGEPSPTEPPTAAPTQPVTAAPTEAPAGDGIDLRAFISGFGKDAQLAEEQIVYQSDEVTVSAVSLRYDPITGAALLFRVDNQSARNLLVQMDTCAVNGYMTAVDLNLKAPSGKLTEGEMVIPYSSLALADVDVIATVEFCIRLVDQDSYEALTDDAVTVITTTSAEGYEPVFDDEGQIVYDDRDIRIVIKGIDRGRQVSEYPVLLVYMYNGTDRSISVQADALWVNGYEMTPAMTATVMPSKHAVDVVAFFDMDLAEYGIDEIESVDIRFRIVDEATWSLIAVTDAVSVEHVE